jgi:hypothetical protein
MVITKQIRGVILKRLREEKKPRKWLADEIGQSESWVSRLLSDDPEMQMKEIKESQLDEISKAFGGLEFYTIVPKGSQSTASQQIARLYDSNPAFAQVADALSAAMIDVIFTPKYIPENEMGRVGAQIRAIVNAPENKGKDGKICRLVLELLA